MSNPAMEKALAEKAGLGWQGKNSLIINNQAGSWFFLGEIFTSLPLPTDNSPQKDQCGKCKACLTVCPTNAFPKPYVLDARRCISYLTIEHRDEIPEEFKGQFQNWAFGCDICQEACPWNWKARPTNESEFTPHPDLIHLTKEEWHNMDQERFREIFRKSAVKRTKYKGLKRNLDFLNK